MPTTMETDHRPATAHKWEVSVWESDWNEDLDDRRLAEDADDVAASRQAIQRGDFVPYDDIARKLGLK